MKRSIKFLTVADVLNFHAYQIKYYGGLDGVRDRALLESALAVPQSGSGNRYFHKNIFEMAAAYTFHIIKNHPFLDGNKRTGMAAGIIFLERNGVTVNVSIEVLCSSAIQIATSALSKKELTTLFKAHATRSWTAAIRL